MIKIYYKSDFKQLTVTGHEQQHNSSQACARVSTVCDLIESFEKERIQVTRLSGLSLFTIKDGSDCLLKYVYYLAKLADLYPNTLKFYKGD